MLKSEGSNDRVMKSERKSLVRRIMIRRLTVRVVWKDSERNGQICTGPVANTFCTALSRVREGGNDAVEMTVAGLTCPRRASHRAATTAAHS
jgi:hypothetical protein